MYKNIRSFVRSFNIKYRMLYYLKKYPLTWLTIFAIIYLSFFKPPQTDMETIPGIDKLVHTCMYGGLCFLLWIEYLRIHRKIDHRRMLIGGILLPVTLSGIIELLQAYATEHRGGDWLDFAANSLGVVLATLVGYYILRPIIHTGQYMAV
jgi:hypothetical protein